MRSKCRCSCVLQFTFRRAVSCVLHRPPSQVIHCTVLCFKHCSASAPRLQLINSCYSTSHHLGGPQSNSSIAKAFPWRRTLSGSHRTRRMLEPPASQGNRVSQGRTWCEREQADGPAPWTKKQKDAPSTKFFFSTLPHDE